MPNGPRFTDPPHSAPDRFSRLRAAFEDVSRLAPAERVVHIEAIELDEPDFAAELRDLIELDASADRNGFLAPPPEVGQAVRQAASDVADATTCSGRSRAGADELDPGAGSLRPGRRVGDFEVEHHLAAGGMGTVYAAKQIHPARRVALKVLHDGARSPSMLDRFRLESEVLARLDHPGIAKVHAAGTLDDHGVERPWFACEFVEGARTLTQAAADDGFDVAARVRLLRDVTDAVRHAHQRGVIHRDLKPGNLLVGGDGRVKVIDFGVARADDLVTRAGGRTGAGELVGTLAYMSPEQCTSSIGDIDVRSDVYALGILLWELLAGRRPLTLDGMSLTEAVRRVAEHGVPRLDGDLPDVDADLRAVVTTATALDRAHRYQSADALLRDLDAWLAGEPVTARAPGPLRRLRLLSRRHRGLTAVVVAGAIGAAAVVLAVFSVSVGYNVLLRQASVRREAALERSELMLSFLNDVLASGRVQQTDLPSRDLGDALLVASRLIDERFADDARARFELRLSIGDSLRNLGDDLAALDEFDAAIVIAEALRPRDPEAVANAIMGRAAALSDLERTIEAAADYDTVESIIAGDAKLERMFAHDIERNRLWLAIRDRRLGDADPLLAAFMEQSADSLVGASVNEIRRQKIIALALVDMGRFAEAERLLREVKAETEDLPRLHPRRIDAFNDLGWCLVQSGRVEDGLVELEEARRLATEMFGERHPKTTWIRSNITNGLVRAGRYDTAEVELRSLLTDRLETLGPANPAVADTEGTLWRLLQDTGRPTEALAMAEAALTRLRSSFGDDHVRTARAAQWTAASLGSLGRRDEAERRLRESLDITRRAAGLRSRPVALATNELAIALFGLGRLDEAATAFADAAELYGEISDAADPERVKALANLARVRLEQGRHVEALDAIEAAWVHAADVLTAGSTAAVLSELTRGEILAEVGREAEALVHLEAAVDAATGIYGASHPRIARVRATIERLRLPQG